MIRVVAAILEDQDRLLICQRRGDQALGGQWEFPGGKMRPSETPREALVRELREELGIEAQVGKEVYVMRHHYLGTAGDVALAATAGAKTGMRQGGPGNSAGAKELDVQVHFFKAAVGFGVARNICFERIVWVRRAELPRYDFLAGDRHLVARLARGEFS